MFDSETMERMAIQGHEGFMPQILSSVSKPACVVRFIIDETDPLMRASGYLILDLVWTH